MTTTSPLARLVAVFLCLLWLLESSAAHSKTKLQHRYDRDVSSHKAEQQQQQQQHDPNMLSWSRNDLHQRHIVTTDDETQESSNTEAEQEVPVPFEEEPIVVLLDHPTASPIFHKYDRDVAAATSAKHRHYDNVPWSRHSVHEIHMDDDTEKPDVTNESMLVFSL